MDVPARILNVRQSDGRMVISFGGASFLDEVFLERVRHELDALLRGSLCRKLAFDLAGIVLIPSSMLGLLLSLRQRGASVQLLNPSDEVRTVLQTTRLDTRFEIVPQEA